MPAVNTVLGRIDPNDLGVTMSHEHFLVDLTVNFREAVEPLKHDLADTAITMDMLGDLKFDPLVNRELMKGISNIDEAVSEASELVKAGGKSAVDNTVYGLGRNVLGLRAISEGAGLNIVCATGVYLDASHPSWVRKSTVDQLTSLMVEELTEGIENTGIKAGLIKVGLSSPLTASERRVLTAAGMAHAETGAPISIHPGIWDVPRRRLAREADLYLDILLKQGVNLEKVYLSHMDFYTSEKNYIKYHTGLLDEYDVNFGYDGFGQEWHVDQYFPGCRFPTDAERVNSIIELLQMGYEKRFMFSMDIASKGLLYKKYGGYGYAHVLNHIIPWLRNLGVSQKQIDAVLIDNPRRIIQC